MSEAQYSYIYLQIQTRCLMIVSDTVGYTVTVGVRHLSNECKTMH